MQLSCCIPSSSCSLSSPALDICNFIFYFRHLIGVQYLIVASASFLKVSSAKYRILCWLLGFLSALEWCHFVVELSLLFLIVHHPSFTVFLPVCNVFHCMCVFPWLLSRFSFYLWILTAWLSCAQVWFYFVFYFLGLLTSLDLKF